MARWLPALLVLLLATPTLAQDRALDVPGPEGAPGVWFPLPDARVALQAREEAPLLRERVRLLRESLTLAESSLGLLERSVALGQEAESALESALEFSGEALTHALAAQASAEGALGAWWRHPAFWAAVGTVLGGFLVGFVAWALP